MGLNDDQCTHVCPQAYRAAISTYGSEPYVCATSTGATVDVYTPSRGVTLGAFICVLSFFHGSVHLCVVVVWELRRRRNCGIIQNKLLLI